MTGARSCAICTRSPKPATIHDFVRAMGDTTGNLPPIPRVFPDYSAPIVRNVEGGSRELTMARWGMPSPVFALTRAATLTLASRTPATSPRLIRGDGSASRADTLSRSLSENELQPDGSRLLARRAPPAGFPRRDMDALDFGQEGRDNEGPVRLPDDRTERGRHTDPRQGRDGHPDDARRSGPLDDRATERGSGASGPLPDDALRLVARGKKQRGLEDRPLIAS